MDKTLIGKNGYLFLQNDSCRELDIHCNNLCLVNDNFYIKYDEYKYIYFLTIFPNKSLIYKKYLPDNYNAVYRPGFDKYLNYLKEHILDGYNILKEEPDCYYKTDTHCNMNGAYIIYKHFVNCINKLFNLDINIQSITIEKKECILSNLELGIGDLTWDMNLGKQILIDKIDTYYYTNDIEYIYMKHNILLNDYIRLFELTNNKLEDITHNYINQVIEWNIVSKYIFYKKNENKKYKVLIFYSSSLLSTLSLYITMFNVVYMAKQIYNIELINIIKPDYVFEFISERFLF